MELSFVAGNIQKGEISRKGLPETIKLNWLEDISQFKDHPASDAFFDLQFEENDVMERSAFLTSLGRPVFIHAVRTTLSSLPHSTDLIRINTWPTFIERNIIEISGTVNPGAETILATLQWNYKILPDVCGFYAPRIVASIINEAYHTLGENVSSKEEIDIAMKLGTNYPFGPFEWSEKIGIEKVAALLQTLSKENDRYLPAPALLKELTAR